MKTPKPRPFAARNSRSRFATVSFSRTLSPTRAQETPPSLRTSFCGSMTTSAVSLLWNSMALPFVRDDLPAEPGACDLDSDAERRRFHPDRRPVGRPPTPKGGLRRVGHRDQRRAHHDGVLDDQPAGAG